MLRALLFLSTVAIISSAFGMVILANAYWLIVGGCEGLQIADDICSASKTDLQMRFAVVTMLVATISMALLMVWDARKE